MTQLMLPGPAMVPEVLLAPEVLVAQVVALAKWEPVVEPAARGLREAVLLELAVALELVVALLEQAVTLAPVVEAAILLRLITVQIRRWSKHSKK